jgi:hypothetical protein
MRIVTLTLNTISLVKNIPLKGCHFFEIINHPNPLLIANNHEYIILGENGPELREKAVLISHKPTLDMPIKMILQMAKSL